MEFILLTSALVFFFFLIKINDGKAFHLAILGGVSSVFLRALYSNIEICGPLATAAESISLSALCSSFLCKYKLFKIENNRTLLLVVAALILLADLVYLNASYYLNANLFFEKSVYSALNPWGWAEILILAVTVYSIGRRQYLLGSAAIHLWIGLSSILIFVFTLLVRAGVITGNTAKSISGTGGIGIGGMSTNEAALFALALMVFNIYFIKSNSKLLSLNLLNLVSCLATIALSQSRVGLMSAAVVLFIGFFSSSGKEKKSRRFIILSVIVVLGFMAAPIVINRFSTDAEESSVYLSSASGGLSGSGRALIWSEYISAFQRSAERHSLAYITGVGPLGLRELYDDTILKAVNLEAEKISFLPMHSDALCLLISFGFLGFLFVALCVNHAIHIFRWGGFLQKSAIVIIVAYSIFDMLQYSFASVLLILSALNLSKKVNARSCERFSYSRPQ